MIELTPPIPFAKNPTIMVVTHQLPLSDEITELFGQQGFEMLVPPPRHKVCSLAQETNPQVVVLDFYLADPNALEIIANLRKQKFTGKILILAGASVRNAVPEAFRLGADQAIGGPQGSCAPNMEGQIAAGIRSLFHEDIQRLTYSLFEKRSRSPNRDWDDWLEAERQILLHRKTSSLEAHTTLSQAETTRRVM
jgi:DNA-binding NarL/FixJ family response regulator